ncbi:MAG: hypothetical protein ACR2KK_23410 [Acidimicrobiales bacterium]
MAAALVAVMALVACGDDEDSSAPATTTTVAPTTSTTLSQIQLDKQKAERIVLTAADVPGFAEEPPDPDDEGDAETEAAILACLNNDPLILRLGEDDDPRGAGSPEFAKGDDSVSSSVTFAENEDQARAAMTALSASAFPTCFSRALTEGLRRDRTLTNVSATTTRLPALTVGDQSTGIRSVVRFRAQGTAVTVYVDNTFIRTGRALAILDVSTVTTPFPTAERSRLATLTAGRLAAP